MNKASAMKKPKRPGGNPSPSFLFASRKPASTVSPVTRDLMNAIEAAGISGRSIHAKSGILHASVLRGSTFDRLAGFTVLPASCDLRPATVADFESFRVSPKGHVA